MTTMTRSQIAGCLHGAESLANEIASSRVTPATFADTPLMERLVARIKEVRLIPNLSEPAYMDLMRRKSAVSKRLHALMVFYGNSRIEVRTSSEPAVELSDGSEYLGKSCYYCDAPSPDKRPDNLHGLFSRTSIDPSDTEIRYCCAVCDDARGSQTLAKFEAWIERLYRHAAGRRAT